MPGLPPREVHVWWLRTDLSDSVRIARACEGLMAPDEVARRDRFVFERDRVQFTLTRGLIRTLLSQYLGGDPARWAFTSNEYGKPYVANGPAGLDLQFNLSHTRGMVACALCVGMEIGVDVEAFDRSVERAIAKRFFSSLEVDDLAPLDEPAFQARFLAYWTAKEAYIKARGAGLSIPLDGFSILLEGSAPGIRFSDRLTDDAAAWQLAQMLIGDRHLLAVAVRRPGANVPILVRAFDPHDLAGRTFAAG